MPQPWSSLPDPVDPSALDTVSTAFAPSDFDGHFATVSRLMYSISGVTLTDRKRDLVKARLSKRLRALGWTSLGDYVRYVQTDAGSGELASMVDALTTNKTSFFRESPHFDFIRERILPERRDPSRPIRAWSAGCSSGEEPYTLAIVLLEALPDASRADHRILATDLSRDVLDTARKGVYTEAKMAGIPDDLRRKWFQRQDDAEKHKPVYEVGPELRRLVTVARLNLMEDWPMKGPFDFIFCRNVMIYFDRPTRSRLVDRFADILAPGGHLFVGHSESLSSLSHRLRYVQPAVYRK